MKFIAPFIGTLILSLSVLAQSTDRLSTVDRETPESNRSVKIYAQHNSVALEIMNTLTDDIANGNVLFLHVETGNAFVCVVASNKEALASIKTNLSKFSNEFDEFSGCR